MGPKKRNPASRSKISTPSSVAAVETVVSPSSATFDVADSSHSILTELQQNPIQSKNDVEVVPYSETSKSSSALSSPYVAVKNECERALTALRRGNHTKSLRVMKELSSKYENSPLLALVHRVHGTVCVKVASIIDDPNVKQRHLKNAIESARRAVTFSPSSIEFAHFYANLLYEAANEAKEFEEVVQECERALAIENPVDPAMESLLDESQQKLSPADVRIANVQSELRSLIQKSNIASISTWMKTLGNGEEKFRLIPIRRPPEDPMEAKFVQTRRPNEIKKATKTPEERRKEIEVRVAAARLLQQKSESPFSQSDGDRTLDSNSGLGLRAGDRRKSGNVRKGASSAERKDWVRPFWNSMSSDAKKELFQINISDLKAHFSSSKDVLASQIISEALAYAEENRDWNFWNCCRCNEKFVDGEFLMQHVLHEHMATLLSKMQSVVPKTVDGEWSEMLLNCDWKPLDVNAAVKMLGEQSKPQDSNSKFLDESCSNIEPEDSSECFADSYCREDDWDTSLKKTESGTNCNNSTLNCREFDKISDIEWMDCDESLDLKSILPYENWPLSDDSECGKLLERIHTVFQALIKHRYLASTHLNKVMNFAVEELQGIAFGSQLLKYKVDQTPACICFLGATELKKILKFLQDLYHACGLGRYPEKNDNSENVNIGTLGVKVLEKIVFSQDASYLSLYEHFYLHNCTQSSGHMTVTEGSTLKKSSTAMCENGVLIDSDALLSWIFLGPSSGEQLDYWVRTREEKAQQGIDILQLLEKEFYELQVLCERKLEHLNYEEAMQGVEDLCLEEGKKREHITEFGRRSYESVLRKRREELVESDNETTVISNRFELDAISNVLKEAESLNVHQFGFEEHYSGMTTNLCDLESGEDESWRTKDYLHQVDSCVEVAVQRQKEQVSIELSKIDARILRVLSTMQQLEVKLEPTSAYDYRTILVPLMKSYMRAHLEDLAEKDATEKSDAAREAFLAELALDSKKANGGKPDNAKHIPEKLKDKKKNKDLRKSKDPKTIHDNELHVETIEEGLLPVQHVDEDLDAQITSDGAGDMFNQLDEESRYRIELEAEERMLEESLELQRRIENEAKLKHLAEQHEKTVKLDLENIASVTLSNDDVTGERKYNDIDMEPMVQKSGSLYMGEGFHEISGELVAERIANGACSENGLLLTDRRPGRRNRRQKGLVKANDGKLHTPVENTAAQLKCTDEPKDTGSKTLRQLQAEEDDEERFQADLKKAVRQSLDSFNARREVPGLPKTGVPVNHVGEVDELPFAHDEIVAGYRNELNVCGTGLKNETGEYNCFLNVIIQSLWHIRRFRNEFLGRSLLEHAHVGDPCVVCALFDIFTALNTGSADAHREPVAPTSLRTALSNLYPDSNFFQEGQMNDASEVLGVLFDCLHKSFTSASCVSDAESVDSNCLDSWDCSNSTCIVHSLFGMDIFERMNCYNCRLESRHLKYTSFFHNINASALRTMKVMCPESSFDELLNLVEMNHQLACDSEADGCGSLNYIHHILSTPPHVFTTVLGWQNTCERVDDIRATLSALSTLMDVSVIYRGLDPKTRHSMVSMVCYYGQHYHCFAYSHDHERWIMYDDKTVKVVGSWNDVLGMCERGHLQPQVLFFEALN